MEGGTWRFATVFSAASPSETAMARGVDEAGAFSRMGGNTRYERTNSAKGER